MNGRYEFHESDWKLFSKKIINWQENHMAELNKEYIALLSEEKDASEKFGHCMTGYLMIRKVPEFRHSEAAQIWTS